MDHVYPSRIRHFRGADTYIYIYTSEENAREIQGNISRVPLYISLPLSRASNDDCPALNP